MLGFVNKIVGKVLAPLLPALGKLFKGKATAAGATGLAATAAAALGVKTQIVTSENVVDIIKAATPIATALFAMIAAFGAGRKAGTGQ